MQIGSLTQNRHGHQFISVLSGTVLLEMEEDAGGAPTACRRLDKVKGGAASSHYLGLTNRSSTLPYLHVKGKGAQFRCPLSSSAYQCPVKEWLWLLACLTGLVAVGEGVRAEKINLSARGRNGLSCSILPHLSPWFPHIIQFSRSMVLGLLFLLLSVLAATVFAKGTSNHVFALPKPLESQA